MVPPRGYQESLRMIERILEAIPYDGWVSAAEIAAVVSLTPHEVSGVIRNSLLGAYVERRHVSPRRPRHYLYRRLSRVVVPAGPPPTLP